MIVIKEAQPFWRQSAYREEHVVASAADLKFVLSKIDAHAVMR